MTIRGIILAMGLSLLAGCASKQAKPDEKPTTSDDTERVEAAHGPDGGKDGAAGKPARRLMIEELVIGTGDEAIPGTLVTVHYTGTLLDGRKFDSSVDRGRPFEFQLGGGQVIQGWEQGIKGMKVGGKRRLTIPPHLAYGDRQIGDLIPARSTLVFEVELLRVN